MKKLISLLMALCMLFGTLAATGLSVFAADDTTAVKDSTTTSADTSKEDATIDYVTKKYYTPEQKLETMQLKLDSEKYGYELYCDPVSGEVAVKSKKSGDILFSNPYDVGTTTSSENVKNQLLSQIILKYTNTDGTEVTMYSYVEAAKRGQILVKNVKNGIRVEYILGRQETRKLLPMQIKAESLDTKILDLIKAEDEKAWKKVSVYYTFYDVEDPDKTQKEKDNILQKWPIASKFPIYVIDPAVGEREKNLLEGYIKKFCPLYTYEELANDHLEAEYQGSDSNPPRFSLALEYYIDEMGLTARLPNNGLRFDESTYSLETIRVLPYMGAGSNDFNGYTFIPDGSGTLVRVEDVLKTGTGRTLSGKIYGQDYAYHEIAGANTEVMRLPVFGLVEDVVLTYDENGELIIPEGDETAAETAEGETAEETEPEETEPEETEPEDPDAETEPETDVTDLYTKVTKKRGFLAILEEGESLATIYTEHGGQNATLGTQGQHKYDTAFIEYNPRPKDQYNLASAMSVGANAMWTVVSERKYTGSTRIRYIMLTDDKTIGELAESGETTDKLYETSYTGMAHAYRDYLIGKEILKPLPETQKDLSLYIETLGVIDVQEKVLSVPVTVKRALTTFDDIKNMYAELSEAGIKNVNFKLTGYYNGGMNPSVPNKIKFEKAAGADDGFSDLVADSKAKGYLVFPEFDISYAAKDKLFDGFSYKNDACKTIDNRYTHKRAYSATLQYFSSSGGVAVSPSVFSDIFGNMQTKLTTLGANAISFGTLGSDLNSDFDKKDPYNREDSKANISDSLKRIREAYDNVMVECGNAYTLAYANHVLNVSLDSSHYTYASEAVPFFGLVFHGYLNFAGTPTNMVGDIDYEVLKIVENGASPYFILAVQNIQKLKESVTLSKYYSIAYDIWKEDLIAIYKELNTVLSDVLTSPLDKHEFLIGERVPTEREMRKDELEAEKKLEEDAKAEAEALKEAERLVNLNLRKAKEKLVTAQDAFDAVKGLIDNPDATAADYRAYDKALTALETAETNLEKAQKAYDDFYDPDKDEEEKEKKEDEKETDEEEYEYTKYTSDNGMIIRVTYENGFSYILNYNNFDVTVEGQLVKAYDGVKIDPNGAVVLESFAALRNN